MPPRWFVRFAWALHRAIYRVTGGRVGLSQARGEKEGTMRLRTIGRRSGEERVALLGYIEDGPNLVTLAMNGWGDPEPTWWLNLQAHPAAMVDLADGPRAVSGRAANPDERARLWGPLGGTSGNLDGYAALRSRETAVVILEPRAGSG